MKTTTTNTQIDPMATLRARALEIITTAPAAKRGKTPRACACGCGGMTKGGTWIPGHDAKALSRILAEMRATPAAAPAETKIA